MTPDVLAIAVAALAMATETRAGESDPAALDLILAQLDDEVVFQFVALLRAYQRQHDTYGAAALQRTGLALARRSCGLTP